MEPLPYISLSYIIVPHVRAKSFAESARSSTYRSDSLSLISTMYRNLLFSAQLTRPEWGPHFLIGIRVSRQDFRGRDIGQAYIKEDKKKLLVQPYTSVIIRNLNCKNFVQSTQLIC